jgi:hypothetical protein
MQPFLIHSALVYKNATKYQLFDSFPKRKIPAVKCGDFCFSWVNIPQAKGAGKIRLNSNFHRAATIFEFFSSY